MTEIFGVDREALQTLADESGEVITVIAPGSTALHLRGAETEQQSESLRAAISVALNDLDAEAAEGLI